jgi:hypothetical protein
MFCCGSYGLLLLVCQLEKLLSEANKGWADEKTLLLVCSDAKRQVIVFWCAIHALTISCTEG